MSHRVRWKCTCRTAHNTLFERRCTAARSEECTFTCACRCVCAISLQFWLANNNENVWVDQYGLHLTINPRNPLNGNPATCINSDWVSSEVMLLQSKGYGTYIVSYLAPVNTMDHYTIFSPFFLYNHKVPAGLGYPPESGGTNDNRFREIDIELGTWADDSLDGNSQFVLGPQPCPPCNELPGWRVRYNAFVQPETSATVASSLACQGAFTGEPLLFPYAPSHVTCMVKWYGVDSTHTQPKLWWACVKGRYTMETFGKVRVGKSDTSTLNIGN